MPLPPFLRSDPASVAASAAAGEDPPAVRAARRRARQRLVGATLLLALGIAAFSLLFETQPRPLPADANVRVAQRDTGMVRPAAPPASPAPAVAGWADAAGGPASAASRVANAAALALPAASAAPPPAADAATASAPSARPAPVPTPASALAPAVTPAPTPAPTPVPARPAAAAVPPVAQPASAAAADEARFVVQVGAFSDPNTLRQARAKVERLGLRTYTQVIGSGSTQRTRVRVGPFASRADAEAAAGKLKAGGLPADILKL